MSQANSATSGICHSSSVYRRRHPERTVLYGVVQHHFESWLQHHRERHVGDPIPAYVERDFRAYLDCGIMARGFARARCAACGHDFLIAFSCSGRGACPSCATRRRVETAAHLVDHVFPRVPVRQWVLSLPKRLRYFVRRDPELAGRVLNVWLRALEARLRACSPGAPAKARFGAVSFIHRFGSSLNANLHYHCVVVDGVFAHDEEGQLCFFEASELQSHDVEKIEYETRQRVLRLFERRGLLSGAVVAEMATWDHQGGFSTDASVRVHANDRAGLERLIRYCARPMLAGERLSWAKEGERLVYVVPKPLPGGQNVLTLTPFELLERIAVLIPPPRRHRHRYHGVFAPNAALRAMVTACAGQPIISSLECDLPEYPRASPSPGESPWRSAAGYLWAALLARIYDCLPLTCPNCSAPMSLIAFVTEPASVQRVLKHLSLPSEPPVLTPARGPPIEQADLDHSLALDSTSPDPDPGYEFDQRLSG